MGKRIQGNIAMSLHIASASEQALVEDIFNSFCTQHALYLKLVELVQKTLSKVILSRGDISPILVSLARKQEILLAVKTERNRMAPSIQEYALIKSTLQPTQRMREFDAKLSEIEIVIRQFLEIEGQLKRYLDCAAGKGTA